MVATPLAPFSRGARDLPNPHILATSSVFPSLQAVGVVDATFAQDGHLDRDAEFDVANHAFAAAVEACAGAAPAQGEFAEDDGVAAFEDFGVGDARVGHVGVDTGGAVPDGGFGGQYEGSG